MIRTYQIWDFLSLFFVQVLEGCINECTKSIYWGLFWTIDIIGYILTTSICSWIIYTLCILLGLGKNLWAGISVVLSVWVHRALCELYSNLVPTTALLYQAHLLNRLISKLAWYSTRQGNQCGHLHW